MRLSRTILALLLAGIIVPVWAQAQPLEDAPSFYRGMANDPLSLSGALAFNGISPQPPDISGALAFRGLGGGPPAISGHVAFTGLRAPEPSIAGHLSFTGLDGEAPEISGRLAFIGLEGDPPVISGVLGFNGILAETPAVSGALSFRGCARQVAEAVTRSLPPLFPETDVDPQLALEGNYLVRWENGDPATAFATLTKGGAVINGPTADGRSGVGFRRDPSARWLAQLWFPTATSYGVNAGESEEISVGSNGAVSIDYGYYVLGQWGGWSDLAFNGGNLEGTWGYQDRTGPVTWERMDPVLRALAPMRGAYPSGPAVAIGSPLLLETDYLDEVYSMRGNRNSVWFAVYGENLWGRHYPWVAPETGLEIDRVVYLCNIKNGGRAESNDDQVCLAQGGVIGLKIGLLVWENVRSGNYIFYLDNQPIPLRIEVSDAPETPKTCLLASANLRSGGETGG